MKQIATLLFSCLAIVMTVQAQVQKPLPSLHVEGRWLVDTHGNHVVLHGVMDTPNMYFNDYRWGLPWGENAVSYDNNGATKCKAYFKKLFVGLEQAKCDVFRLHLDCCWTNDPSSSYTYAPAADQPADTGGEANIKKFNPTRLKTFMRNLFFPLAKDAINHGMYVVMRPPGVCPGSLKVGDYYNDYLMTVWDIVSQNDSVKKYAGQISIELANEPVSLKNADGQDDPAALHDFFQPIVNKIRENGFTGIIWAPGTGWQSNYTSYASFPIEGADIGYAVHDYTGWYGSSDNHCNPQDKINQFRKQVPVVDFAPVIITEVDWSPENPDAEGHYNEHGDWVQPNYGTWSTGSTSKWGKAYKACLDYYGNISMTLSGTHCLLDVDKLIADGTVTPAFGGLEEACAKACFDWYAEYYNVDWAHPDYKNVSLGDLGNGKYKNPVVRADFPDPDVVRAGDTFYMVSTTMHHFPGATILKSKDLVNWQYCAQPLAQLSTSDRYNLLNDQNAYAAGMWACSMTYHDGKFYILINGNDAGGYVLSTTDPEGIWDMKKLSRIYYDPGMLFDNGKVYVACGINDIKICELDENFNFKQERSVVTREGTGLEGCHLYKIGEYYYIYATYGGWPSGQVAFRSKNIFGPYEEKMLVEKTINNKPNTIHQGALIETATGEWWTIMQQDVGCLGRFPNLQPVKWTNDWPIVGNNGVPYETTKKPVTGAATKREPLPTNDNFRSYPLGMQWQWNHNPDDAAWTLFERPGWLRLRTSETVSRLTQARNMLTQRIFAFESKASTGTVRLDASNLQEGDHAGICIFQDPYAMLAVRVKDGQKQLLWRQDTLRVHDSFTPTEQVEAVEINDIVYLRATVSYSTSKTQFYYSLDNVTYHPIGGETSLGFSLTVFVGARFGLFCYATNNDSEGYADFDWFSTENDYDESYYFPDTFEGYNQDMLTAESLALEKESYEIMTGNSTPIELKATFRDGHTEDVAAKAQYSASIDGIIATARGRLRGLKEGDVDVVASYKDPMGNVLTTNFTVRSSFFPFGAEFITTNFFGEGTYNEKVHTFKPSQYGQMGWQYTDGVDWSDYKYLVINLKGSAQRCNPHLNIFTANSIWGDCCASPDFGSKKQIVINLQEATYTSGDRTGQPLDLTNIHIVAFWANGNGSIPVNDMFLTNNDDYTREDPDAIEMAGATPEMVDVYSVGGICLRRNVNAREALQGLPGGIYIVGGKKVVKIFTE
ncbi:MAG: family 43 glycosylhydrolase [Bacteroidaceae bacterium]|nr:family 43 glycosylhydrolase [Bacteroidaceae bacterium]